MIDIFGQINFWLVDGTFIHQFIANLFFAGQHNTCIFYVPQKIITITQVTSLSLQLWTKLFLLTMKILRTGEMEKQVFKPLLGIVRISNKHFGWRGIGS
jgi:hypothetical protein